MPTLFRVDKNPHLSILHVSYEQTGMALKIRVSDITDKAKAVAAIEEIELYPTLKQAQDAGECRFLAPVTVSLSIVREFDHIRVHGNVATQVLLSCSRCLCDFTSDLDSTFTVFYTKSVISQYEDEIELGEEDLVSASYSGDEIDFSDEVAEQILLELPYKPLCSETCKGLCTSCGADLNSSECRCSNNTVSMAFSSLQGLKVKN
jgi:uncharacterized protein